MDPTADAGAVLDLGWVSHGIPEAIPEATLFGSVGSLVKKPRYFLMNSLPDSSHVFFLCQSLKAISHTTIEKDHLIDLNSPI